MMLRKEFWFFLKHEFVEKTKRDELKWQCIDGVTFGVQVDSIEAWLFMVLLLNDNLVLFWRI
jgi:hypothetical protein